MPSHIQYKKSKQPMIGNPNSGGFANNPAQSHFYSPETQLNQKNIQGRESRKLFAGMQGSYQRLVSDGGSDDDSIGTRSAELGKKFL